MFAALKRHSPFVDSSQWKKFAFEVSLDFVVVTAVYAFVLFFATKDASEFLRLSRLTPFLLVVVLATLLTRGTYQISHRFAGLHDFINLAICGVMLGLSFVFLQMVMATGEASKAVVANGFFFALASASALVMVRIVRRQLSWRTTTVRGHLSRALVVGAGDAGESIIREVQRSQNPKYSIEALVDDDIKKARLLVHGVRVQGTTRDIPELVNRHRIEQILIAIPTASAQDIRRILSICHSAKIMAPLVLPATTMLTEQPPQMGSDGSPQAPEYLPYMREVDIEDLLERDPVSIDDEQVASYIKGEPVLVTGGGGSIGGELARQICTMQPASLILVGKGENSIYEIEQELIQTRKFKSRPIIADVRDFRSMEAVFSDYRPSVVFHAAAHKHVPLMQSNPCEAIRNNIIGTKITLQHAIEYGAKRFILVSTDKAVNPSSVMGATKRVAEMLVSALAREAEIKTGIVRFGNVLGSRGSLVPMLKLQIRNGGPVRITHPNMTRYFMTIPEAVRLILQAGALGNKSEIFILDMGQPVQIMDIATNLIRFMGLSSDQIKIEITGIRPGEKMHEELTYDTEQLRKTDHPKISMVSTVNSPEWSWLEKQIDTLETLCEKGESAKAESMLMDLAFGRSWPANYQSHFREGEAEIL